MAVAQASDLAKDMVGTPLFRSVSFKLERRERLTLAGRNGAGKTTLLRILAGETSLDGGQLTFAKGTKVALHDQRPPREDGTSLRDYVLSGCAELIALEEELARLEQAMAEGDMTVFDAYSGAQARLEHAGGYTWREGVNATLHGLGFADHDLDRDLATFSGGELTRASLARALSGDPDLLLLDEPTNHLDITALEWLEAYLQAVDAAVVLVAHDRWFLEAVGTSVLELEGGRGRFFKGTWHAWRQEKAQRELALGRAIEKQSAEIAKLQRFVDRFSAGTRAKQAQSRAKQLDKVKKLSTDPRDGAALGFTFKKPERTGRVIFELEDARVSVGDGARVLLEDAEFWLERGEHVSLVGANGAGKSTLLKVLSGEHEMDAGKLRKGHNLQMGLLSQHAEVVGATGTVLESAQRATGLKPMETRALLGRFLFSGEAAEKPIDGLSGGERQRLSLACLVASGRQRAGARRADQPPRPGEPRGARSRAAGFQGRGPARLPRPGAAGRRRLTDRGRRGRDAAFLHGRLARVRARAGRAGSRAAEGPAREPPARPRLRRGADRGARGAPGQPHGPPRDGGAGRARRAVRGVHILITA